MMSTGSEMLTVLWAAAARLGKQLGRGGSDATDYLKARAEHLATILGQPGFEAALVAERDNAALFLGLRAMAVADAADAELRGILTGALAMGARVAAFG